MPRFRKESDPLAHKRQFLAEQERLLSERMSKLSDQLERGGEEAGPAKPAEPPVWRLEEDHPVAKARAAESAVRRAGLGKQRQRDKILFFITIGALFIAVIIFVGLAHSHLRGP